MWRGGQDCVRVHTMQKLKRDQGEGRGGERERERSGKGPTGQSHRYGPAAASAVVASTRKATTWGAGFTMAACGRRQRCSVGCDGGSEVTWGAVLRGERVEAFPSPPPPPSPRKNTASLGTYGERWGGREEGGGGRGG